MKPHYRFSYSAGVWVLQGVHRLAPVAIFPSNLRPADDAHVPRAYADDLPPTVTLPPLPVIDRYHIEWLPGRGQRDA